MGCFSTCFPKSKPAKSLRPGRKTHRLNQLLLRDEALEALELVEIDEEPIETPPDKEADDVDVPREKVNLSGRKKVTFDLNVKIYEGLPVEDESESDDLDLPLVKKGEDGKKGEEEKKKKSQAHSDSSSCSSLFSFPPSGYRYQDCRDSDDEFDQLASDEESDLDSYLSEDDDDEGEEEVNNDHLIAKQESSESLFSLSVDSRKHKLLPNESGEREVNSPMPIGLDEHEAGKMDKNADSVLNPVENLTQWKAIKARAKLASQNNKQAKENRKISSVQESNIPETEEPVLKDSAKSSKRNANREIAVDASLSNWLVVVGSEEVVAATTPSKSKTSSDSVGNSAWFERSGSPKDFEDRPILGALTMDEIRMMSAGSTPRKSPSRNPDDMPIIGSVGSYWSHTGQASSSNSGSNGASYTRSKFTQASRVKLNSAMAFEKRLEGVL